jgi:hypothetical protein
MIDLKSPGQKSVAVLILLVILISLCFYYTNEYENNLDYPSYGAILSSYPQGMVVQIYGTVTETYPGGFIIQENYYNHVFHFRVQSDASVRVGDDVDLLGVLGESNEIIRVTKIKVSSLWKYQFLLLRSFLAFIFLVFIFHRYWCWDFETFEFRRR